jgi:D-alanyl-lipoteichoic acid acyltransferase DltB (MBOAT superfamily)
MIFNSFEFLIFFPIVLVVTWALTSDTWRWRFLLAASMFFYGWWDWRFLGLLAAVVCIGFIGGMFAAPIHSESRRRIAMAISVSLLLLLLSVFKYMNFFVDSFHTLTPNTQWSTIDIILPVGISFFIFHAICYVVDVRTGRLQAEESVVNFALYICFFPHLVAGPIVRATDFMPQIHSRWRAPDAAEMTALCARFAWGLFKKLFIADRLGSAIVDPVFADPTQASAALVILAVFAFGIQIVADFSGYSDMAIATAGMLGIRFRENFLSPYSAVSLRDFWRRWHVSLSFWIRDYVYIPLGGNRSGSELRNSWNLLLAMSLCGLWHGAAWTYVLWGALHGSALAVERVLRRVIPPRLIPAPLGWLLTLSVVFFAWALFRAPTLDALAQLLGAFVEPRPQTFLPIGTLAFCATASIVIFAEHAVLRWHEVRPQRWTRAPTTLFVATLLIAGFLLATDSPALGVRNFIYFQF